jgi:hypothetical protein
MIRRSSQQYAKIPVLVFIAGLVAITAMPALASGTFQKTGSMNVARIGHTATLLSNGEVLAAGGDNNVPSTAELYNPSTGAWTLTGSMTTARGNHQAVLLPSGEVLVAGGGSANDPLASAELYNPSTGTWTPTGSMHTGRSGFSLTLLANGEVLAVQGTSAELYNPATETWTVTGSPTSPVGGKNAALLLDGQVLAIGTQPPSELYSPSSGTWSASGGAGITTLNVITPRLSNGEVLAISGFISGNRAESAAALYDPSTGQFTYLAGPCQCAAFNGALLRTGEVLVAGGTIVVPGNPYPSYQTIKSAELWDPPTLAWTTTGNLNGSRSGQSMTVLQNGEVLVAGGETIDKNSGQAVVIASAELYKP